MAAYREIFAHAAFFNDLPHNRAFCDELTRRSKKQLATLGADAFDPRRMAHLVVDAETRFIPSGLEESARRIDVMASFCREVGVENHWFWFKDKELASVPDFSLIRPATGEAVIAKRDCSAFRHTSLHEKLKSAGVNTLLVSGYRAGACVAATLEDGRAFGYETVFLSDCSDSAELAAYNFEDARSLHDKGVVFAESRDIRAAFITQPG